MSKIKDEKTARELFGKMSSFGIVPEELAKEETGLSREALIDSVDDEETKTLLQERKSLQDEKNAQGKGKRGRPRKEDSDLWQKMTFIVSKEQLSQMKDIAYKERVSVKDVLFQALERYLSDYEEGSINAEKE